MPAPGNIIAALNAVYDAQTKSSTDDAAATAADAAAAAAHAAASTSDQAAVTAKNAFLAAFQESLGPAVGPASTVASGGTAS